MRRLFAVLVLVSLAAQAAAQCGPDSDKPYPTGSTECPAGPADGEAPAANGAAPAASASGETCDACGGSTTYTEALATESSYAKRTITANGCPNHYSVCTGKALSGICGAIGAEGTQTEATIQKKIIEIPASPVIANTVTDKECSMGAIAIALNGVSIYGGAVNGNCDKLDVDDATSEWTSFDMCSGHSQNTGDYHYHFPPSCLLAQAVATNPVTGDAAGHSPQIGWSLDGFPIYGPLYTGGVAVAGLDVCGGKLEAIPSLDKFKYRYYFPGATSNLYALPGNPKPDAATIIANKFVLNCYKGCTWATLSAGTCTGATGVESDYTAAATAGYTTQFNTYGPATSKNFQDATYTSALISSGTCKTNAETNAISGGTSVRMRFKILLPMWAAICFLIL